MYMHVGGDPVRGRARSLKSEMYEKRELEGPKKLCLEKLKGAQLTRYVRDLRRGIKNPVRTYVCTYIHMDI
jgi:hypothetical protein